MKCILIFLLLFSLKIHSDIYIRNIKSYEDSLAYFFKSASKNIVVIDSIIENIENRFGKNPSKYSDKILGYYGAYHVLKGRNTSNLYHKHNNFLLGIKKIDEAIEKNENSLELRFMRFSIYTFLPIYYFNRISILSNDARFIYNYVLKKDYTIYDRLVQIRIIDFMVNNWRCSEDDRWTLRVLRHEIYKHLQSEGIDDIYK